MRKEPIFMYEEGKTICLVEGENGDCLIGTATCHPDDVDMANKRTGEEIAYMRVEIQAYRRYRDDIKIRLKALNQLYYSINKSKKYNPHSYESKMLRRQIRILNEDLNETNKLLNNLTTELRNYIKNKDDFYKAIRKNRKQADS